jgi:hypothetical protein
MNEEFKTDWDVRGNSMAKCFCSKCGRTTTFRCAHTFNPKKASDIKVKVSEALPKAMADGWSFKYGNPLCPICEKERKDAQKPREEPQMSKEPTVIVVPPPPAPPLRQPTRDQKRLIVAALEESYDTKNQRYKGTETDKGIADMLADGIMSGWVAAVREDMFGPDGNEEMTDLAAEIKEWMKRVDLALSDIQLALGGMELAKAEVSKYLGRLNKIAASIGPKAERL